MTIKPAALIFSVLTVLSAAAHAGETRNVSTLACAFSNGVTVQAKENGKLYYNSLELGVHTTLYGFTKDFTGSSNFSVKPEGEVTVTLENKQHELYFIRGFVDKKSEKEQIAMMTLQKPGFTVPGSKTTLGTGTCKLTLRTYRY